MDSLNYYALYFVNKQNLRSFCNVMEIKILKSDDETKFLQHIFQDEYLVSQLTADLKSILYELKSNVRVNSKKDFRNYFFKNEDYKNLRSVEKSVILQRCLIALNEIIPKPLLDCNHNYKIFKKNVKLIVYSMRRQCFSSSIMLKNWNYSVYPWNSIPTNIVFEVLEKITNWIYRYLLAAMIALNFYVTTCKLDSDDNKLHFFWKSEWQKFYDKHISRMLFVKIIKKKSYHRIKRKFVYLDKNILINDVPKLYMILKPNNECRPIVHYKKESNSTEKYKTKEKLGFLKVLAGRPPDRIENQFESLHKNWLKLNKPKLYFVKSDLSNAFGSINRTKLIKIFSERHQLFQNTEKSIIRKQKFSLLYKELSLELNKPLLIRTGSAVYEWAKGLVQGYKYSPALAELYYSYMDELYFSQHLKKNDNNLRLFTRIVDDYLYITDSLEDAHLFLQSVSNYRNVNYNKTIVNFSHTNIQCSNEITYLGYTYNTDNLYVSRADNVYTGQMCYKISFTTATEYLDKFIENRIGQSAIQISSNIFNLNYNNEKLIWQHIFITLILSANKFCTILAILSNEKEMNKYMLLYKKIVTVKLCNAIIETMLKTKSKYIDFIYCENHFRYLSFKALLLCARYTQKCNILIPFINKELAKTNCIFGKWRDHSSIMNKDGTSGVKAVKNVCKRPDLALIMQDFNTLPKGFECFNDKMFYS